MTSRWWSCGAKIILKSADDIQLGKLGLEGNLPEQVEVESRDDINN